MSLSDNFFLQSVVTWPQVLEITEIRVWCRSFFGSWWIGSREEEEGNNENETSILPSRHSPHAGVSRTSLDSFFFLWLWQLSLRKDESILSPSLRVLSIMVGKACQQEHEVIASRERQVLVLSWLSLLLQLRTPPRKWYHHSQAGSSRFS